MASDDKSVGSGGRSLPHYLIIVIPALLVLAADCLFAFRFVDSPPPKRIVITTGGKSGAYHAFAEHYRAKLAGRASISG